MPKTIKIAIDGNEANITQRVGSNVYAFEIVTQLEKLTRKDPNIEITVLLATPKISELPAERKGWQYKVITPKPLWTQWALPLHLFLHAQDYNLLYTPGHYAPRFSPILYVSSVMDVAFLHYPQYFKKEDYVKLKEWTCYSVKHAKKVIAISNFTKEEIVRIYKKKADDVIVAHPALYPPTKQPSSQVVDSVLKKYGVRSPYLLFVGTIQPRKNIETIIAAFEMIHKKRMLSFKPQLVLAGKVGWLAEPIMARIHKSSVFKYITVTGFISEKEKEAFYKGSDATLLLGLYEGFGIPALEAMHYGSIPLVSNTTSLPEVTGDAGISVDPNNIKAIAICMVKTLTLKPSEKAKLRKKAREQIKQFDWESSAKKVLDTLLDTIEKSIR